MGESTTSPGFESITLGVRESTTSPEKGGGVEDNNGAATYVGAFVTTKLVVEVKAGVLIFVGFFVLTGVDVGVGIIRASGIGAMVGYDVFFPFPVGNRVRGTVGMGLGSPVKRIDPSAGNTNLVTSSNPNFPSAERMMVSPEESLYHPSPVSQHNPSPAQS